MPTRKNYDARVFEDYCRAFFQRPKAVQKRTSGTRREGRAIRMTRITVHRSFQAAILIRSELHRHRVPDYDRGMNSARWGGPPSPVLKFGQLFELRRAASRNSGPLCSCRAVEDESSYAAHEKNANNEKHAELKQLPRSFQEREEEIEERHVFFLVAGCCVRQKHKLLESFMPTGSCVEQFPSLRMTAECCIAYFPLMCGVYSTCVDPRAPRTPMSYKSAR